ncbi:hypothetical protein F3Y22_tig00112206pilonHSYRG00377 [Hibiscus syriacus]|uniref:Uncharacterized protein n=1 Tax=Hibiscus syriacus TaxID=106335 RepID=A0A6A2X4W6_HIBSY|nr:hypothetical protein F3Y22_tig00112206pilonHSYRG00377 [Hibiscus syriacus]
MSSEDDDNREFDVSHKILLGVIASLLGVEMIIVLLYHYTKYRLRRRAALNLRRTQIAALYESSVIEPPKSGLDPLVIVSLPMFSYKLTNGQVNVHEEPTECSACLGTITEDSTAEPTLQALEDNELYGRVQPTAPPLMESDSIDAAQVRKEGGASGYLVPLQGCFVGRDCQQGYELPYRFDRHNGTSDELVNKVYSKARFSLGVMWGKNCDNSKDDLLLVQFSCFYDCLMRVIHDNSGNVRGIDMDILEMFQHGNVEQQSNPEFRGPWNYHIGTALCFTFSSISLPNQEHRDEY